MSAFLPTMFGCIADQHASVRQAAVYGVGISAEIVPTLVGPYLQSMSVMCLYAFFTCMRLTGLFSSPQMPSHSWAR